MKKILLILIFLVSFVLISCNDNPPVDNPDPDDPGTEDPYVDPSSGETKKKIQIHVTLDTKEYKAKCQTKDITATLIEDPNYLKIKIDITSKKYKFTSDNFDLYINDTLADSSTYTIEDHIIHYCVNDPNWSPFV